jgi:hypothetical protein
MIYHGKSKHPLIKQDQITAYPLPLSDDIDGLICWSAIVQGYESVGVPKGIEAQT